MTLLCGFCLGNASGTDYELWKYDGALGSMPIPPTIYNNALCFEASDAVHGIELWRLQLASQLLRITAINRLGSKVSLAWETPGGVSNVLEASDGDVNGQRVGEKLFRVCIND